jgi:hypothetical protein
LGLGLGATQGYSRVGARVRVGVRVACKLHELVVVRGTVRVFFPCLPLAHGLPPRERDRVPGFAPEASSL